MRETIDGEDEQVRRAEGGGDRECESLSASPVVEGEEESEGDEEDDEAWSESGDLRRAREEQCERDAITRRGSAMSAVYERIVRPAM